MTSRFVRLAYPLGLVMLFSVAFAPVACGGDKESTANGGNDASGESTTEEPVEFTLEELPEVDEEYHVLPHTVLDEAFEPVEGETYVLQGRVKHVRERLFAIELMDDSKVEYNPLMPEPWIYCCADPSEVQANFINVRFVREGEEMPVRITAQTKPSFRFVDLISVVGTVTRSGDGTPVFLATGYVIDERPELGDHVEWPES